MVKHPTCATRLAQEVLVVSLLDGHVVAVEPETGRLLWTFDSGAPLVSSKQASVKSPSSPAFNVFPGADGGLYAYHGMRALEVRSHTCIGCVLCSAAQTTCSISGIVLDVLH